MVALVQWINEIYYDNSSGDVEVLVEVVVAPNMSSIDLSTVLISLYNGGNMMTYGTHSLNTCSAGDLTNGFQVYTKSIPGIQNDTEETTLSLAQVRSSSNSYSMKERLPTQAVLPTAS